MPAIWPSSERPISVRMVWVDGVRHAILSKDDPLLITKTFRRRPQSTSAVKDKEYPIKFELHKPSSSSESSLDSCFMKLHQVVEKSSSDDVETRTRNLIRRQVSAPVCARITHNALDFRINEPGEEIAGENDYKFEDPIMELCVKLEEGKYVDTPQLSMLSERVLQWLDLPSKTRDFKLEDEQSEVNDSEGEETASGKVLGFRGKSSNGNCMKIIVPIQHFVMQKVRDDETGELLREKRVRKRRVSKNRSTKMSVDLNGNEDICKSNPSTTDDEFEPISERSKSKMWTSPGRTQLHIFMPSLKYTEVHWMSSQESLFCE